MSFAAVPSAIAALVISNALFWSPLMTASANAFKSVIPVHLNKITILLIFLKPTIRRVIKHDLLIQNKP
jgi:hypothetical protein